MNDTTTDAAVTAVRDLAHTLHTSLAQVLKGKTAAIDAVITTVLAGGHVLLEDVPGVGKTTLATALAGSVNAEVRRIQFTSDMLPTDVTGVTVYDDEARRFQFHPGPRRGRSPPCWRRWPNVASPSTAPPMTCRTCSWSSRPRTRRTWPGPSRCPRRSVTVS